MQSPASADATSVIILSLFAGNVSGPSFTRVIFGIRGDERAEVVCAQGGWKLSHSTVLGHHSGGTL